MEAQYLLLFLAVGSHAGNIIVIAKYETSNSNNNSEHVGDAAHFGAQRWTLLHVQAGHWCQTFPWHQHKHHLSVWMMLPSQALTGNNKHPTRKGLMVSTEQTSRAVVVSKNKLWFRTARCVQEKHTRVCPPVTSLASRHLRRCGGPHCVRVANTKGEPAIL
jgi:hypothetical protein